MKKTTGRKNQHQARIAPSMLDEMEAMKRHPGFRRSLSLQQSMLAKQYRDLTREEEEENNAPRTRFRVAAIMEAQDQWLSRSIQDIRNRGETAWARDAVNRPFGDDTATITMNDRILLELPIDELLLDFKQYVLREREKAEVKPIQHPRTPEVDQWKVYDLKHERGLGLPAIAEQLFKVPAYLAYGDGPSLAYRRVRAAYQSACKMIKSIGDN